MRRLTRAAAYSGSEMPILDVTHDALGRGLLDHLEGRLGPRLLLESDDGSIRLADLQAEDFFAPPDAWPWWERQAIGSVRGSVLDLGAGAGRSPSTCSSWGTPSSQWTLHPELRPSAGPGG